MLSCLYLILVLVNDQIVEKKFNHSDLNRDGKVDNLDYAIFANNWKRTGIVKGSDPNALGDYADIDDIYDGETGNLIMYGDGEVNENDLVQFVSEWGWNKDDPNSW